MVVLFFQKKIELFLVNLSRAMIFLYLFSAPEGARNCTYCRGVLLFSQAQKNINYSSFYIALKLHSCSSSVDLRVVSAAGAATLARELELLVVDLVVAPVSEDNTRLRRSLVLSVWS